MLYPRATGDLDGDGRSELVGEFLSIEVYESTSSTTYPTELVWSSPPLGNTDRGVSVGDTDRDGQMEIITSHNLGAGSILLIYENRGDNDFALAFSDTTPYNDFASNKAIGDLDGDGRIEIALSGIDGWVLVYESSTNDTWELTWVGWTGMANAFAVAIGPDIDGNGKNELFVTGTDFSEPGHPEWKTIVFESDGDNTFAETAAMSIYDGFTGQPSSVVSNLDHIGSPEYVIGTKAGLWIFGVNGIGNWPLVGAFLEPGSPQKGIHSFDLNKNGRPELVWPGFPTTQILEYRSGTSSVGPIDGNRSTTFLSAYPNPADGLAELHVPWSAAETQLSVFDVRGKLVQRRTILPNTEGRLLWSTQHLASGIYMLRLEGNAGRSIARGRVLVTH